MIENRIARFFKFNNKHIYSSTFWCVDDLMPFNKLLLVVDCSFAASLAVVICTNTGVVEESTEITITFNTLHYFCCRRIDLVIESNIYVITIN